MDIVVGCPVANRNWILPTWFDYVEKAFDGVARVSYAFALDLGDEDTLACIDAHSGMYDFKYHTVMLTDSGSSGRGLRNWHQPSRLSYMAELRNGLLGLVRKSSPDLFFSIDSDILVHPDSVKKCIDPILEGRFDAVASKVYLGKGQGIVNGATYSRQRGLFRTDVPYLTKVDVLMAYKAMNSKAYNIDYKFNTLGEDIGWSMECKENDVKLGYTGEVASKHVMEPSDLDRFDKRCGY